MIFALGFEVGFVRFLWRVVGSYVKMFFVNLNVCRKLFALYANPQQPGFINRHSAPPVLQIDRSSYVAQVIETIIRRIAVFVVNIVLWPLSGYVQPRKAAALVKNIVDPNNEIPVSAFAARYLTSQRSNRFVYFPPKYAGGSVVVYDLAQSFRCNRAVSFAYVVSEKTVGDTNARFKWLY